MREGWEMKTLGEVCDISNGSTPLRSKKEFWENGNVNWFTINDIRNQGRIINYTNQKITKQGFENSSLKMLPSKTVLLCCTASVGEYAITNIELTTNQQFNGLIVKDFNYLLPEYLFYFSSTLKARLLYVSGKTTIDFVSMTKVKKVEIPIPPIQEQKQIVAILDKAFTAIDQAKANIEKNIENATELFQSKLNAIFSQKGNGWEEKSLGEVCYVLNGYAFKSKDAIEKSNTQLLRMGNLYKNVLGLGRKPVFYPDSFAKEYETYLLKEGDLIMSLTGTVDKTDYGYTVKIPKLDVDLLLNQRIMKIEVHDSNVLNKDYLKNYLLSPDFLSRLYETASGTRQANLSSRTILTLKINYPSQINKQLEVVQQFKKLRKHIFKLEHEYKEKLNNLEDLKKSILQKAFSGELTEKPVAV